MGIKDFFRTCHELRLRRIYLLLHSYELIPAFLILSYYTSFNPIVLGAATGYIIHLALDQFTNTRKYRCRDLFYFFSFRLRNRFRKECLVEYPK